MNSLLHPFWTGSEMINELATPLRRPDGSVEDIALLYPADEILSVRSATLERTFAPGADYRLENGKLVIPAGSAIPAMAYGDYYLNHADAPEKCFPHSICGWIRFGEGDYFHQRQIAVSYRHHGTWPFPVPEDRSALLPRTVKTLAQGRPMRLLIFGDSISTGCNASGWANVPPYQKPWFEMAADALREKYASDVTLLNTSVGGMASDWGAKTAVENGAAQKPDLCVIAFGMNDGSLRVPVDTYIANTVAMMDTIARDNPDCEFILVATTVANPEVRGFVGLQEDYLEPLKALEKPGVCVMDMTTFHKSLLRRKLFRDMTGNNVNHPNDFLSRAYAQVMLRTMGAL